MRKVIIGDVHGCLDELKQLISITKDGTDEFIFVGDLVDKGPHSVATLEFIQQLSQSSKVTVVEGNHENKNFRFWKKLDQGETERAMQMKNSGEMAQIHSDASVELKSWLKEITVPYAVRPELGLVVVHGGIEPGVEELPTNPRDLTGKNKKKVLRSMYVRYISEEGLMIPFGQESPSSEFWATKYDGRFGHVYFGHQPWLQEQPKCFDHATGLDLGCVHGGWLCAAVVDELGREFVKIQANKEYCPPI